MKLHIGCGDNLKSGYINVDEFNENADLRVPIQKLNYPDDSVERIEGYMILEHLSPTDARHFVSNAYRMLERRGVLVLECPDLEKVCRLILAFSDDPDQLEKGSFGLRGIFGEPKEEMTIGDYHKWGYTPITLAKLVQEAGFSEFTISDGISHCLPLRDIRVEAVK